MPKIHLCNIFDCERVRRNQCCNYCNYRMICKNRCLNKHDLCGQMIFAENRKELEHEHRK
ncbi:hypothetical protein [Ruminococcus sp. 210702-SL.1.03]|uniref:hypothetical protein n=1 Tax=Ruminococcus sp. 210702-SL.1.03 TaxID=2883233 RepID=UPI001D082298|nr:hypothetical protein [Ruminococcus sp. 210702-SL.1.03]MCB6616943.1 hypothetical protein [Ruminococcus sp. 210702-SL.1.03]DAE94382.1 MAG TPA: hypothetical protein [Caudoviricetes sp.]